VIGLKDVNGGLNKLVAWMGATSIAEIAYNCILAARSSDEAIQSVNTGEAVTQQTISIMTRIAGRVKDSKGEIHSRYTYETELLVLLF
jgi:hypothetical protein